MRRVLVMMCGLSCVLFCLCVRAEDKVPLGEPGAGASAGQAKTADLMAELKGLPDGVLKVKTNTDGSFKSLVVKATVEIQDALGGQKGKRLAHKDAEMQCKRMLAQWLGENCTFLEGTSNNVLFVTKGESAKDAAGNVVSIRKQEGTEYKAMTENSVSVTQKVLSGLITLQSEVTADKQPEYVLILGLSQDSLKQAGAVKDALSGAPKSEPAPEAEGAAKKPAPESDNAPAETKTNPLAKDFL